VFREDSTTSVAGIVVTATDESGKVFLRALTGESGQYILRLARPARYTLRALRIGFRPTTIPPVQVSAGETRVTDIVLRGEIVSLAAVNVRSEIACRTQTDSSELVVRLWEQARTALSAASLGAAGQPLVATARVFERTLDPSGASVRAETSSVVHGTTLQPFVSLPPDSLARAGYVADDKSGTMYRAPDADVLLSESFAALHCFWAQQPPPEHADWIGIGVRPAQERIGIRDIEGTLWLDKASSELRLFEYGYTGLSSELVRAKPGGRVEFLHLSSGHWIVNRWAIRMPQMAIQRSVQGGIGTNQRIVNRTVVQAIRVKGGETIDIVRNGVVLYHSAAETIALARPVPVDTPSESPRAGGGAVLRGRIIQAGDTIAVPGAEVLIEGAGLRHWADNHGRFRFAGLPRGSYEIRVRMLGYQPSTARMQFEESRSYDRDFELRRLPYALTEVRIEGRAVKVPVRYEEVYRRASRGLGTLIDRDEIERLNPSEIKSLFNRIPGVLVNDRGITFQRCQGGLQGPLGSQQAAKVQVYIDGVRMTNPAGVKMPGPGQSGFGGAIEDADAEHVLRLVPPTAIQAIEVYRGVAQIPVEFLDDACAVIAIWTKAY